MRYPDEIRPVTALTELNYNVEIRQNELEMAEGLINSLTERFDPGKYNDRYREALMELIQKKISGEEVTVPKIPREESVMDLVEALKASIQMSRERREAQEGQ